MSHHLFPVNARVYTEAPRCTKPHVHTAIPPDDSRFVLLRSLQNTELQAGTVVFYDPDRNALRPFRGIFIHQIKQDYREVSPRGYETQFSRYPDLRRIHCLCAADQTISRDASLVRWLHDNRGTFYAACHTDNSKRGCGMEIPLIYYNSPSQGSKNLLTFEPADSLIIEERQRVPSEASLSDSARSRSNSVASDRSDRSGLETGAVRLPRAPFARPKGAAAPPMSAPKPAAQRRGLLSQDLHVQDARPSKRARSMSLDAGAPVDPPEGVELDNPDEKMKERQERRGRIVDLAYRASNPFIGLTAQELVDLGDLLLTEHCNECDKDFLRVDYRAHVVSNHRV